VRGLAGNREPFEVAAPRRYLESQGMGRTLTVVGLVCDLVGVVLLAVAAGIRHSVVKGLGALRAPREPTGWRAPLVTWSERSGWVLVIGGFGLQLAGAW
jgi:hypothetical protein